MTSALASVDDELLNPRRILALDRYICARCETGKADRPYCLVCDGTGIVNLVTHTWYVTTAAEDMPRFGRAPSVRSKTEIRAREMADMAYCERIDRLGNPLIRHTLRVSGAGANPTERIIGLLHDIAEDTGIRLASITGDYAAHIGTALDALTHRKGEEYRPYIERIVAAGRLAMRVKLCDIRDNMNRIHELGAEEEARLRRRYIVATNMIYRALSAAPPHLLPNPGRSKLLQATEPL